MGGRHRRSEPVQPPASDWTFPSPADLPPDEDLVATGADLEPGTLLAAYGSGYFPMPVRRNQIGWFHPDPRGVLWPDRLRVSRSLRRSLRRYEVTVDAAFDEVIRACANPDRPLGWIDGAIVGAYTRLHRLGWAHSVEAWDADGLAGGLYGVSIGGFFAGESMFHRRTDASKVALFHLVDLLADRAEVGALIDVQWLTPHLESLGAIEIPRQRYVEILPAALAAERPGDLAGDTVVRPPPR